jgi:hypothetical protein
MKPKYNRTPLSYVELYPAQEKPPHILKQIAAAATVAAAIYVSLLFLFSF